jgi:hypothetical protein
MIERFSFIRRLGLPLEMLSDNSGTPTVIPCLSLELVKYLLVHQLGQRNNGDMLTNGRRFSHEFRVYRLRLILAFDSTFILM